MPKKMNRPFNYYNFVQIITGLFLILTLILSINAIMIHDLYFFLGTLLNCILFSVLIILLNYLPGSVLAIRMDLKLVPPNLPREKYKKIKNELYKFDALLANTLEKRTKIEQKLKQLKNKNLLSNRILVVKRTFGVANAFVVGHLNGYYILLTNTHVVGNNKNIKVQTKNNKAIKIQEKAVVVLRSTKKFFKFEDIAILALKEEHVQGGNLKPFKFANGFKKGDIGTFVSFKNNRISSGHLIHMARNYVALLGAMSVYGDSGSPILVKRNKRLNFITVLARRGPITIFLRPTLLKSLIKAIDHGSEDWFVTDDDSAKKAVRMYLNKIYQHHQESS